jgi:MATE family multidrug resistance protein
VHRFDNFGAPHHERRFGRASPAWIVAVDSLRREVEQVARLSAPVALVQIGLVMIGVVDTLMLGRVGVTELAAGALGNAWQWTFLSLGLGLVMGIDPMISQAHGRGDGPGTALALQRGIVLALIVSVPVMLATFWSERGLLALEQEPGVAALAGQYNRYKLPTVPCYLIYSALRQYLQGRGLMAPATWVMWVGNLVHVVLNWGLIFGQLGLPALGVKGAAIASSISTALLVALLAGWVLALRLHDGAWRPWDRASFSARGLLWTARLGLPVGLQISLESTAFSLSTTMAGWLGREALASHQVVLNMASLAFMVPLGISQAASIRVGNLIGAGDEQGMRRAVKVSIALGALVMVFSAVAFSALRFELPSLYTDDRRVLALAAQILPLAAAFQLFDGTQVVAGGVLRGMGRPDAAAVVNLVGYYGMALPFAYTLGFVWDQGLPGIWTALATGLTLVCAAMLVWVRRTAVRPLAALRVQLEGRTSERPA